MKLSYARTGAVLVVLIAAAGCPSPRSEDLPSNPERKDAGAEAGRTDGPGSGGAGEDAPVQLPPDPACPAGQHTCAGKCTDDRSPMTCGRGCDPCPNIEGGTATCDGIKCAIECPGGQKPCLTKCIDMGAPCDGTCEAGKNPCNGACVDAKSLSSCGTSCAPCPTSPNGVASCDGDKCDLKCNAGYHRCGDACVKDTDVANCGTSCSPCAAPSGGTAGCDGTTCGAQCPSGTKLCAGACLPDGMACNGQCPGGKHDCSGNCVANNDVNSCGTSCMPCSPPANADATCNGSSCGFTCRSGYHACGNECRNNNSVDSCGDRCSPCDAPAGATRSCRNGTCEYAFQCSGCNTSPHCDGGNVVTGRCNIGNGNCDKTVMTSCTGGRSCSGSQCVCPGGRTWTGSSCVFQCSGCDASPHCDSGNVVTESCNQNTGTCDKTTTATCSGGRTCQSAQCVCTGGRVWNGSACVFECPTCTPGRRCSGDSVITTTGVCDASNGRCVETTQGCGGKGCNTATRMCNQCASAMDCGPGGLCQRCVNGSCEDWNDDPKCGEVRPGYPDPIKTCKDCRAGSCVPINQWSVCESGGGFCNSQGRCQYCGGNAASTTGEQSQCCPVESHGGDATDRCSNPPGCGFENGVQNMCTCRSDNRCRSG
jgi:hypothetical protein